MPKRIRDLSIESSVAADSRVLIVKDTVTAEEVTVEFSDFVASLNSVGPSDNATRNYCYNPEGRLQQYRGEGDPDGAALGIAIDADNSKSKDVWLCDGWIVEEIGYQSTATNLEVSHAVVDSADGPRAQRLELTIDSISGGVPATDNALKLAFMLDVDERKQLESGAFNVSFVASFPRASTYTFYVKGAYTTYVESFTVAAADTEESFTFAVPVNTHSRTGTQDGTFIADKHDGLEIGVILAGTKGVLDSENISETASDGYQTTAADAVLDYFIKDDQESAMAAADVYAITELQITKQTIGYNGYSYDLALQQAERYFQKSHIQSLPAYKRFIIFDVADDGTPYASNLDDFRAHMGGAQYWPSRNMSLEHADKQLVFKRPLKTHSNISIGINYNPVAVDQAAQESTAVNQAIGYLRYVVRNGGGFTYSLAVVLPLDNPSSAKEGPYYSLPPVDEALDFSSHAPDVVNTGRIPGWIFGKEARRSGATGGDPANLVNGPILSVEKNSFVTNDGYFTPGELASLAHPSLDVIGYHFHWYVYSYVDTPGTITTETAPVVV